VQLAEYLLQKAPLLSDAPSPSERAAAEVHLEAVAAKKATAAKMRQDARQKRLDSKKEVQVAAGTVGGADGGLAEDVIQQKRSWKQTHVGTLGPPRVQQKRSWKQTHVGTLGAPLSLKEAAVDALLKRLQPSPPGPDPREAPALIARMRELEEGGRAAQMALESLASRFPGSPLVRDRRAVGGMQKNGWGWGDLDGVGEGGRTSIAVGRGDMGVDLSVHNRLEGSIRPEFSVRSSLSSAAIGGGGVTPLGVGGGSPQKGVGVGNSQVLVRKARQLEDLSAAQSLLAGILQGVAVCCIVLQCVAVCHNYKIWMLLSPSWLVYCSVLRCVAVCCGVTQLEDLSAAQAL